MSTHKHFPTQRAGNDRPEGRRIQPQSDEIIAPAADRESLSVPLVSVDELIDAGAEALAASFTKPQRRRSSR